MKSVSKLACVVLVATSFGCSSSESGSESEPVATGYELRRQAFFDATVDAEPSNTYSEVVRVMRGVAPDESKIQNDLDRLIAREDTSDFRLPGLLWLLYKYSDSEVLGAEMVANIKGVLLRHKFWPDERQRRIFDRFLADDYDVARDRPLDRLAEEVRVSSATVRNELAALEELGYLLEGELKTVINNKVYTVKAGETIYLKADNPAEWTNPGPDTARLLWIKIK